MFSHQKIMQFSWFDFKTSLTGGEFFLTWSLSSVRLERLLAPNNATSLNINYLYLGKHN